MPNKRQKEFNIEDDCFICQEDIKDPMKRYRTNLPLSKVDASVIKLEYDEWKTKLAYPDKVGMALEAIDNALEERNLSSIAELKVLKAHRRCRPTFVLGHDRFPDAPLVVEEDVHMADEEPDNLPQAPPTPPSAPTMPGSAGMYLRSQANNKKYDKFLHCVVCVAGDEKETLHLATTFNVHCKLQEIAYEDIAVSVRLQAAFDAIAGDVKYHSTCVYLPKKGESSQSSSQSIDLNKMFELLSRNLKSTLRRGQLVLLSVCQERIRDLCKVHSLDIPPYLGKKRFFTYKLATFLPELIVIPHKETDGDDDPLMSKNMSVSEMVDLLTDENSAEDEFKLPVYQDNKTLELVHTALRLRGGILAHPKNKSARLTEETAYASVFEDLYKFVVILHDGTDVIDCEEEIEDKRFEDEYDNMFKVRRLFLDICQDLMYTVTRGKNIPPKQYALSLTTHQMSGRNKTLLELGHKTHQLIPYKKILQADTAIAEETLKSLDEETGAVIPPNMVHGRKTEFGEDNLDTLIQSVIAGNNSVNVTNHVGFQKGPKVESRLEEMKFSSEKLEVPNILTETIPLNKPIVKECPLRVTEQEIKDIFDHDTPSKANLSYRTSRAQSFTFLLIRNHLDKKDLRRNWTAFNRDFYSQDPKNLQKPADIIAPCPILPFKADDHDTINTVIERSKVIVERMGR